MLLCLSSLRQKSPQDNQGNTSFTVCPFNDCPQDTRHPSPFNQVSVVVLPTFSMFNCTSAALCAGDPLPFQWLPSVPADGTRTCSGTLGIDGNVSKVLVPEAGDSMDALW